MSETSATIIHLQNADGDVQRLVGPRAEHVAAKWEARGYTRVTPEVHYDAEAERQEGAASYESMKVDELRALVADRGIEVAPTAKKADLVAALTAADAAPVIPAGEPA